MPPQTPYQELSTSPCRRIIKNPCAGGLVGNSRRHISTVSFSCAEMIPLKRASGHGFICSIYRHRLSFRPFGFRLVRIRITKCKISDMHSKAYSGSAMYKIVLEYESDGIQNPMSLVAKMCGKESTMALLSRSHQSREVKIWQQGYVHADTLPPRFVVPFLYASDDTADSWIIIRRSRPIYVDTRKRVVR